MTSFENLLLRHCAPTLIGIKQSNLFSCPAEKNNTFFFELDKYNALLNPIDIYLKVLYTCKNRYYVITYRKKPMLDTLKSHKIRFYLNNIGYPLIEDDNLEQVLNHLGSRITGCDEFPHEVGFFLGYPVEDVLAFIKNKGENFKFCGYWKVYSNEEQAKKLFRQYKRCSEVLLNKANTGTPILNMIRVS